MGPGFREAAVRVEAVHEDAAEPGARAGERDPPHQRKAGDERRGSGVINSCLVGGNDQQQTVGRSGNQGTGSRQRERPGQAGLAEGESASASSAPSCRLDSRASVSTATQSEASARLPPSRARPVTWARN